jgi:hypothetical protein
VLLLLFPVVGESVLGRPVNFWIFYFDFLKFYFDFLISFFICYFFDF